MSMRRSMLFIPGNRPGMILNAQVFGADSVIFDLEDAVPPNEKDAARILVGSMIGHLDRGAAGMVVRINASHTAYWKTDLEAVGPWGPEAIILPKCQEEADVGVVGEYLAVIEGGLGLAAGGIRIIPLIESALGVENAGRIAGASSRVAALLLGAEDLAADLGVRRTKSGREIFYSRSRVVIAARAAGLAAIDTPFTDIDDDEGLIEDATLARELGFSGKAVISPRHVAAVNRIFSPNEEEVAAARRIVDAGERAEKEGRGAISLDGKMIDAPIVARARQIIQAAISIGGSQP